MPLPPHPSRAVAAWHQRLAPHAERFFGPRWVAPLARAAGISPKTLHSIFRHGQRMPAADLVAAVEAAVRFTPPGQPPGGPTPTIAQIIGRIRTLLVPALAPLPPDRQDFFQRHLYNQVEIIAGWARAEMNERRRRDR